MSVALLAAGVVILALVTPVNNVILQESGTQHLSATDVGPDQRSTYVLAGEPRLIQSAAALDVHLAFQMRVDSVTLAPDGSAEVVSTFGDAHGLRFNVSRTGRSLQLISLLGGHGQVLLPVQRLLVAGLPLHQWIDVRAEVLRNQSYQYLIDGQTVQSFTWNRPILNPAPVRLEVNGTFGGSVRNVTMDTTFYRPEPRGARSALVRAAQLIGLLSIVVGTILLARRFLTHLIPPAHDLRHSLVQVTFWTMGGGIALNVLIDLFHFQSSNNVYIERNTWLLSQYPRFSDFFQVYETLRSFNPYGVLNGSYPPLGYWLVAPVVWMTEYAALFVVLSFSIGFLIWWFSRAFTTKLPAYQRILIVVIALCSLPVTFAIDRGNVDLLVFVIVVVGIAAFERHQNTLAAVSIGLAASAKIFPILYLFVFLRGRRIKFIVVGLVTIVAISIVGFLGFHFPVRQNIDGLRNSLTALQSQLDTGLGGTYFNASIPGWLQAIGYVVAGNHGTLVVRNAIEPYVVPIDVLAAILLAWFLRWRERSLWRSVTLITLTFLLLTDVANYYELIFLFVPLSLFVRYALVSHRTLVIGAIFGIALAPRAYFYLGDNLVDCSVLTTAPILVALAVAVIHDGQRERRYPLAENSIETTARRYPPIQQAVVD